MHRGSLQGDVEWYVRKAIDSGGPVLELGAGTGRVTIPIAEAGVRVSALDLDAGMRLESMIRTEEFAPDGALLRTNMMHLEMAYLYPSDISSVLTESGFEMVRLSGDFTGHPFERDRDELVVEARKRDH